PVERGAGDRRSIGCGLLLPGARPGRDQARVQVDPADAVVDDVADVERTRPVVREAVRLVQLGFGRRAVVATEPGPAGPGNRGDVAGLGIDTANNVVADLDEIQVPRPIPRQFVGLVQRRSDRGPTVAGIPALATAGEGRDGPVPGNSADAVVIDVA